MQINRRTYKLYNITATYTANTIQCNITPHIQKSLIQTMQYKHPPQKIFAAYNKIQYIGAYSYKYSLEKTNVRKIKRNG